MAKSKKPAEDSKKRKPPIAFDEEAHQNYMVSLATDCAERQLLDGTASAQVIVHYLRLACDKNKLELEKLKNENELLKAKTDNLKMVERSEGLIREVLDAIKGYRGEDYE